MTMTVGLTVSKVGRGQMACLGGGLRSPNTRSLTLCASPFLPTFLLHWNSVRQMSFLSPTAV